jgi:hypothetical protein
MCAFSIPVHGLMDRLMTSTGVCGQGRESVLPYRSLLVLLISLSRPAPLPITNMTEPIAYINGKRHVLPPGRADQTLLYYLRGEPCRVHGSVG